MGDLILYNQHREQMRTGDLLLWRANSLLGVAIRHFSKADVNHASLVMHFEQYEGGEHRRFTTEALGQGIVLNLLSRQLEQYDGKVWWLPLKDDWESRRAMVGTNAMKYIGTPYDYKSLFRNAFGRVSADARELFCSEYCFLAYGLTGTAPTPGDMPGLGIFKDPVLIYDSTDYKVPIIEQAWDTRG
jgi:hypothetical protein